MTRTIKVRAAGIITIIPGTTTITTTATPTIATPERTAWKAVFDGKWIVIGLCVAFTVYIAVVPLAFLLWQSFRTPQTAEADAVYERRIAAHPLALLPPGHNPGADPLPPDTVGLALSGGGIRSATFTVSLGLPPACHEVT